ncbi:regulator of chromosome condensation 1/beta-lactamase-inhibitor protein II, partial [Baffinella frigidus]
RAFAVSAGGQHSLVLSRDGAVFAFGKGEDGQLGVNDSEDYHLPVCVVDTPKMVVISAGGAHSLCLDSTGTAYSFGAGGSGRLGQGDVEDRSLS